MFNSNLKFSFFTTDFKCSKFIAKKTVGDLMHHYGWCVKITIILYYFNICTLNQLSYFYIIFDINLLHITYNFNNTKIKQFKKKNVLLFFKSKAPNLREKREAPGLGSARSPLRMALKTPITFNFTISTFFVAQTFYIFQLKYIIHKYINYSILHSYWMFTHILIISI